MRLRGGAGPTLTFSKDRMRPEAPASGGLRPCGCGARPGEAPPCPALRAHQLPGAWLGTVQLPERPAESAHGCEASSRCSRTAGLQDSAGDEPALGALHIRWAWSEAPPPERGNSENRAVHAPQQSQLPGRSLRFRRTARCACVRVCFCVHAYTLPKTCVILCKEYESRKHVLPVICSSMHVDLLGYSVHIIFHHAPQCVEGGHTGAKDVICALGGVW